MFAISLHEPRAVENSAISSHATRMVFREKQTASLCLLMFRRRKKFKRQFRTLSTHSLRIPDKSSHQSHLWNVSTYAWLSPCFGHIYFCYTSSSQSVISCQRCGDLSIYIYLRCALFYSFPQTYGTYSLTPIPNC